MNHCPVYHAVGGHAYGWVYVGPMGSVLTPLMVGLDEARSLPDACTLNGRCAEVCPMEIPLSDLIRKLRERGYDERITPPRIRAGLQVWAFMARRPALYRFVTGLGIRVLGLMGRRRGRFRRLPLAGGWTGTRDLPAPAGTTFMSAWSKQPGRTSVMNAAAHGIPGQAGLIGAPGRPGLPDGWTGAGVLEDFAGGTAVVAWSTRLARLRLGPTRHARRPILARACRAPPTRRSLVPSRRKPLSKTWLNCEHRRGSRRLARLRLGPTKHARHPFPARVCRAPPTRRSLVPSRRKPLSESWLECKDRRGSRRLAGRAR